MTETDNLIEPDFIDEMKWYRLQSQGNWYIVRECCRVCATRKLQIWVQEHPFERVQTIKYPIWLISLVGE